MNLHRRVYAYVCCALFIVLVQLKQAGRLVIEPVVHEAKKWRSSNHDSVQTAWDATFFSPPSPEDIAGRNQTQDSAVSELQEEVKSALNQSLGSDRRCRANYRRVDLGRVQECIHANTSLQYPLDADAHFNEIRLTLAEWSQHGAHRYHNASGYDGPWIENEFIHRQVEKYRRSNASTCLPDLFGPYIPILVPWTDIWLDKTLGGPSSYPDKLVDALLAVLRPDVPYVVLTQNDEGWAARHPKLLNMTRSSITQLSAGGYGHVPVPLIKSELHPVGRIDVSRRSRMLSYVGSLQHAPQQMRKKMNMQLKRFGSKVRLPSNLTFYSYYYGPEWVDIMLDSRFSMVPRGFGRTSYHLMEAMQLGLVPVVVYSDLAWLPYQDLLFSESLVYAVPLPGLRKLGKKVFPFVTDEEIQRKEERILELRETHFTMRGALRQIDRFLWNGIHGSDLRCQLMPDTVVDLGPEE